MNDETFRLIGSIITWLTVGGGIAVLSTVWTQRKKEPIDKNTALVANAVAASDSAVTNANEVTKISMEMYKMLDLRLQAVEKSNEDKEKQIHELEKFQTYVKYWYADLVVRWDEHRILEYPPVMNYIKEGS